MEREGGVGGELFSVLKGQESSLGQGSTQMISWILWINKDPLLKYSHIKTRASQNKIWGDTNIQAITYKVRPAGDQHDWIISCEFYND